MSNNDGQLKFAVESFLAAAKRRSDLYIASCQPTPHALGNCP